MKADALTFIFGAVGVVLGFLICLVCVKSVGPTESTPTSVPSEMEVSELRRDSYTVTIVTPTLPPQEIGTLDVLAMVAEDFGLTNTLDYEVAASQRKPVPDQAAEQNALRVWQQSP